MRLSRLQTRQQGFSLVEVLIALIIMSVGMLGIAGLYVQSLQAGRTSMFRHHAVTLAGDVADRIRANPRAGAAYAGAGVNNSCHTATCTETTMAENDIFLWQRQATDTLPGVAGLPNNGVTVTHDGTVVPAQYTITISWIEPGETPSYTISIPVFGI